MPRETLPEDVGAEEHVNSAGAKEVLFVQYARVDGVLRGGAPPLVRRDARGKCEQQRRAVRTASVESQPPVLPLLEFTKLWSCRRMYRASKLSQITKTFKKCYCQYAGDEFLEYTRS